jgi:hypothetical protein
MTSLLFCHRERSAEVWLFAPVVIAIDRRECGNLAFCLSENGKIALSFRSSQ